MRLFLLTLCFALLYAIPAQAQSLTLHDDTARAKAAGYVISGQRWPGKTITYFDTTRGQYKIGVAAAVREWNSRGLPIKFVKVNSKARAQVIVSRDKRINLGGLATVGRARGAFVKLNMDAYQWPDIAWVASHEFGHVLGLDHSRGCAVMSYSAYTACKWPGYQERQWQYRCRLQERDDLLGVKRLYGGTFKVRPVAFCLKNLAAQPVSIAQAVSGDRTFLGTITWTRPVRAAKFYVARGGVGEACAKVYSQGQLVTQTSYQDTTIGAPGRYCYTIWAANRDGAPTVPKFVYLDYAPPLPTAPSAFAAIVQNDGYANIVALSWQVDPSIRYVRIFRSDPNGPCITNIDDYDHETVYARSGSATDYPQTAGTYCYTIVASDDGRYFSAFSQTQVAYS